MIETSTTEKYILITTGSDNSYKLGCMQKECTMPDRVVKMAEVGPLRMQGAVRIDSSSEFFLGRGRRVSILKKINAFFV